MKSFKQFIAERVFIKEPYIILENPGWNELKNIMRKSKRKEARFFSHKKSKKWYAWDSDVAIHGDAAAIIAGDHSNTWSVMPKEYEFKWRARIRDDNILINGDLETVSIRDLKNSKMYKRMFEPSGLEIRKVERFS